MKLRFVFLIVVLCLADTSIAVAQWSADGNAVCTATGNQLAAVSVSDGAGGAIVAWSDTRGSNADIYAQRVNMWGAVQWTVDGVGVRVATSTQTNPAIASDGAGGAIVFWEHLANNGSMDIYAQRVSSAGALLWTSTGVLISQAQHDQLSPRAISDGAGGAIVVWQDNRAGSNSDADVYARRINASGVPLWTSDGVAICTAANAQTNARLVSDGTGGAIIAWSDIRDGATRGVYVRRVDSAGTPQWTADGVALAANTGYEDPPAIASDGAGGAIVAWQADNGVNDIDIFAQRLSASGNLQWTAGVVDVCGADSHQTSPQIVADGFGGAVVTWQDLRDVAAGDENIYAQRLNSAGLAKWAANGVALCSADGPAVLPQIVSDGAGGAVVCWVDTRGATNDIYARRINGTGTPLWTSNGVPLCSAANAQVGPAPVSDGFGGVIAAWIDLRSGAFDVYANRVTGGGAKPTGVGDTPGAKSLVVSAAPNPFSGTTRIEINSDHRALVTIDIFDVSGRRVRTISAGMVTRSRSLSFDGRDKRGALLPSGVYFYRVSSSGTTVTHKMVITR